MINYKILLTLVVLIFHFKTIAQPVENAQNSLETAYVDSLYSEALGTYQQFWVKLPEGYDSNRKYPVIYLLDGFALQNILETVYENYWGHYLPHMILVGISNQKNRTKNLSISQIANWGEKTLNPETGGAAIFTEYIEKELIPYIDKTYKTSPYRTLIGHSYGGLFVVNTLLNHDALFKNYIAIDPSIDWDDQNILKQAKEKLKTKKFHGKSLFVSLAAEQLHMFDERITMDNIRDDQSEFTLFARSIISFSELASSEKQSGLNFSWKVYKEDLHGTVPLPSMRDGLVFLFDWYQFKSPQKYNNPETTVEEIKLLLKKQKEIYTRHFAYSTAPMIEEMLNGYGYMNLQMEQPEKAFLFFETAIKYYPQSANAYGSMADYYESKNDYAKALVNVRKAYELSGSDYYMERVKLLETKQ